MSQAKRDRELHHPTDTRSRTRRLGGSLVKRILIPADLLMSLCNVLRVVDVCLSVQHAIVGNPKKKV
jgi:hypothetical protein